MYPFVRLAKEFLVHRNAAALPMTGTHVSHHICWPWDLDPWVELNNGRTLTLYDLGRLVLFRRIGVVGMMRQKGWGGTVAGSSVRYRRRVRAFDRIEMRSRILGWDHRFIYVEQAMWKRGECTSHSLLRTAVTDASGIVTPDRVAEALGVSPESPPLPAWVSAWAEADGLRPWPPEI
jgi:acyl-CoA thioesterase FadM